MNKILSFNQEPNVHLTENEREITIELLFGFYDISGRLAIQENKAQHKEIIQTIFDHLVIYMRNTDPEISVDFLIKLIKPKTIGDSEKSKRYLVMYNAMIAIKDKIKQQNAANSN